MVLRNVERGEVVEVVLDLRTRGDVEARAAEQRLDAQPRARHRVQPSRLLAPSRERDIDAAFDEPTLDVGALELRAARLDGAGQLLLRLVDARPGRGTLGGWHAAALPQLLGEGPPLAEPAHAHALERGRIRRGRNLGARRGGEG